LEKNNMSKPIKEIEGIGAVYAEKLANIGINTVHALLDKGCVKSGRREIAEKTGISETLILEWVNMADLFRIEGVGEEYSDLLEEAGVDTVVELSKRDPENLYAKMKEVNEQKKLVKQLPTLDTIKKWVENAKTLPRKVEH
jgi:predicted flap endonuclease-1-like 5' DNA nuclease